MPGSLRTVVKRASDVEVVLRIVSGAAKKTLDRGSPVWLPQSNAKDDQTALNKGYLIEEALLGRLDHMLRTAVRRGVWGRLSIPS